MWRRSVRVGASEPCEASSWLRNPHGISFASTVMDCRYSTIHSRLKIVASQFTIDEQGADSSSLLSAFILFICG
jgi:hypothetical protein